MGDLCDINRLCRCCHAENGYRSLLESYIQDGTEEIYSDMLQDTLNVCLNLSNNLNLTQSTSICEDCVQRLREATRFKHQVLAYERSLTEYSKLYSDEVTSDNDYKSGEDIYSGGSLDVSFVQKNECNEDLNFQLDVDIGDHPLSSLRSHEFIPDADDTDPIPDADETVPTDKRTKGMKDNRIACLDLPTHLLVDIDHPLSNLQSHEFIPDADETDPLPEAVETDLIPDANQVEPTDERTKNGMTTAKTKKPKEKLCCDICQRKFVYKAMLKKHMRTHMGDQVLECHICKGKYKSHKQLLSHITSKHSKGGKFPCTFCIETFEKASLLKKHLQQEHVGPKLTTQSNKRILECHICNQKFKYNVELLRHINSKHSKGGKFPCTFCTDTFEKASLLKKHLKKHFIPKFICNWCKKEFRLKSSLSRHFKIHTGEKDYTCKICNKSFRQGKTLKFHIMTHTGEKPYVCDVCGRSFPQNVHLKRHIFAIHKGMKPYKCSFCIKQFSTKSYLITHERQHTGEKPYTCDVCKKSFTAYTSWKVHYRHHTGIEPYKCRFCTRRFMQIYNYQIHERSHTGERPFKCEICDKAYPQKSYLKIHMKMHTAEKSYVCEICMRAFRTADQLETHKGVHTGINPYSCKICNANIGLLGNLTKHMRLHLAERPFSCDVCKKQFSSNDNMKVHMRIHSGEKPFSCDLCKSQFRHKGTWKTHKCLGEPRGLKASKARFIQSPDNNISGS